MHGSFVDWITYIKIATRNARHYSPLPTLLITEQNYYAVSSKLLLRHRSHCDLVQANSRLAALRNLARFVSIATRTKATCTLEKTYTCPFLSFHTLFFNDRFLGQSPIDFYSNKNVLGCHCLYLDVLSFNAECLKPKEHHVDFASVERIREWIVSRHITSWRTSYTLHIFNDRRY